MLRICLIKVLSSFPATSRMTFSNLVESSAKMESLANLARETFDIDEPAFEQANLLRYEGSEATRSIYFVYLYQFFM